MLTTEQCIARAEAAERFAHSCDNERSRDEHASLALKWRLFSVLDAHQEEWADDD